MADTRCSNPEYQLDVDTMTIEYTIYSAIDTKLKALKATLSDNRLRQQDLEEAADRWIQNFDILLNLFKVNHPNIALNEGTNFNIKILEFLIIFNRWMTQTPCNEQLVKERSFNARYRLQWLEAWAADPQGPGRDIKPYIEANTDAVDQSPTADLSDVLLRFLDLSAEISNAVGGVNEHWYKLAAEFMLHCAVERVQDLIDSNELHKVPGSSLKPLATYISECFAWGIVQPPPSEQYPETQRDPWLNDKLQEQDLICVMFRSRSEAEDLNDEDGDTRMGDHNPAVLNEDPRWTTLRTKYHSEIFQMIKVCQNTHGCTCMDMLGRINQKYPSKQFLHDLLGYIDAMWCINMNNTTSGKPILVQIEEGSIKGLSDLEFKEFLDRVGLKMGSRGEDGKRTVRWAR